MIVFLGKVKEIVFLAICNSVFRNGQVSFFTVLSVREAWQHICSGV